MLFRFRRSLQRPQAHVVPRRRWLRLLRAFMIGFALWLVVSIGLGAAVALNARADNPEPADVIIVLGAGLPRSLRPPPALIRRATRGAELWQAGYAPRLICSGGYPVNLPRSEADACAEVLRGLGVPAEAILLEERSRSTEENARFSHAIMQANGWETAIVVSEGYHLLRAAWIFGQEGMTVTTSRSAEDPPFFRHLYAIARESIALQWQAFKTLLNLPVTYMPIL